MCLLLSALTAESVQEPDHPQIPNLDRRQVEAKEALTPTRAEGLARLQARIPYVQVDLDDVTGAPKWIRSRKGFLTQSRASAAVTSQAGGVPPALRRAPAADPHEPVKQFINDHAALFGHGAEVLAGARVKREFVGAHNGLRTVVWEQQLDGLPIFQSVLIWHITKNDELVNLSSQFLPNPDAASKLDAAGRAARIAAPAITLKQAVVESAKSIGVAIKEEEVTVPAEAPKVPKDLLKLSAPALSGEVRAQLVWFPMSRSELRLCWKVELAKGMEAYLVLIDAQSGEGLFRHGQTAYANETAYTVFISDSPSPFSPGHAVPTNAQPALTNRVVRTWSAFLTNASPLGWINDGDFETVGNNVDARRNWEAIGIGYRQPEDSAVHRPSSYPSREFDPPLTLPGDPLVDNSDAGVVQLFFWCNWMHDRLYKLGFTEAAGNFQFENVFGGVDRGGVGGDPLLADAQWGAPYGNANNAAINVSPTDGVSPTMYMLLWNGPTPNRDGDLDAEIILHEYTHGLSNRRVGGGVGITQLQSRGMGEGWSDFMALAMLSESDDGLGGNYAMGGYSTYQLGVLQENYYFGIRRYPYSIDLTRNPLTFKDIDPAQTDPHTGVPRNPIAGGSPATVHRQGEVWCAALWEVRAGLVAEHEFTIGNELTLQLVVDGMNLAPPNPTFVQARDAIIQADEVMNGGANRTNLWARFAKRGLGYSAAAPAAWTTEGVVEAFDLPTPSGELWTYGTGDGVLSSPALGPDGVIYFGSADGKLYALNPDGTKRWDFLGGTNGFGGPSQFWSSPAVGPDGAIYIGGMQDCTFYAVNPDGSLKWKFAASNWVFSSPSFAADGAIHFGCYDGRLYTLNPDGTLRWTFETGSLISSSPAVDKDGVVYFGALNSKLYAIRADGTPKWTNSSSSGGIYGSPAINWSGAEGANPSNGRLIFGSLNGYLYGLNTGDGSQQWLANLGAPIYASPVVDVAGNAYVGTEGGTFFKILPDGDVSWTFQTDDAIYSSPAIGWDGRIYQGSFDQKLYVLNPNGTLITNFTAGGGFFSSPVIGTDGRVYLGCVDSKLYVYPAGTLLLPSAWPMFKGDARHLGNQGFVWFDQGTLLPNNRFQVTIQSLRFPLPWGTGVTNSLRLEWSSDLTTWQLENFPNLPDFVSIPGAEGGMRVYRTVECVNLAILAKQFFLRARVPAQPLLRSRNPYGFVKVSVPPGTSMIANPLNTATNTLAGIIPNPPDGTMFYKWTTNWCISVFEVGSGWTLDLPLLPGEGGIIVNPTSEPFTVTFIGEVLQGHLAKSVPSGYSIYGSLVPQAGGLTSLLGFGPEDGLATGDKALRWVNLRDDYVHSTYNTTNGWSRTDPTPTKLIEPRPEVAEAFWINALGARIWSRNFQVWP